MYKDTYFFKFVTAQAFIFTTEIMINSKFNRNYDYSTINEFYTYFTERKDKRPQKMEFEDILSCFEQLDYDLPKEY